MLCLAVTPLVAYCVRSGSFWPISRRAELQYDSLVDHCHDVGQIWDGCKIFITLLHDTQ
jgi:hypothetical protein